MVAKKISAADALGMRAAVATSATQVSARKRSDSHFRRVESGGTSLKIPCKDSATPAGTWLEWAWAARDGFWAKKLASTSSGSPPTTCPQASQSSLHGFSEPGSPTRRRQ